LTEASVTPETQTTETPEKPAAQARSRRKFQWRPWLRALHRDIGYFVIGLTVIYAVSGLAVNHIADWDPSFRQVERTHQLSAPLPADDEQASTVVLSALGIRETPRELFRAEETKLDVVLEKRTLHVDTATGKVLEEGEEPRFFLRIVNWLHLNRGKKAWTYFADGYAVFLLFLALSGLFMIPGRKGLFGRGAVIATLGAALPIVYITLSGGP
jgi:hypothetical protein